jgi:hypothetical protein
MIILPGRRVLWAQFGLQILEEVGGNGHGVRKIVHPRVDEGELGEPSGGKLGSSRRRDGLEITLEQGHRPLRQEMLVK